MTSEFILQCDSLTKYVRSGQSEICILYNVSFGMKRGETCSIVGPSGSGKTTLLTLAAGLDKPSAGKVTFQGTDLSGISEDELSVWRGKHVGFIFQNYELVPSLTALENVLLPLELLGYENTGEAENLLERVGLKNRIHHYPNQLSGGEQQRVAISRAFINKPLILFADEPTGSLDRESAETAMQAIFELNSNHHCSILLVTHDSELSKRLGRTIALKDGKLA